MVTNESILEVIKDYISNHGYPPTINEIGDMVGFKSKNTTWNRLQKMFDEGVLETDNPGSPRAIRIPGYVFKAVTEKGE